MLHDMPPRKPSSSLTAVLDPALVMSRTGLDHSSIVAGVAAGNFPKPFKVGDHVVWKQDDVSEWINVRIAAGDQAVIALNQLSPAHQRLIDALTEMFIAEDLQKAAASSRARATHDDVKSCVAADAPATATEAIAIAGTVFLTFAQTSAKVALGRTSIYAGIAAKTFPAPIKSGKRSLWVEAEVESWMQERIAERDGAGQ
jgi:prophage regulatory protein